MRNEDPGKVPGSERQELERNAFNTAFSELGLCWHWDEKTYSELQAISAEAERLRSFVESRYSHLLKAYDADFLVDAIRVMKMRCLEDAPGGRLSS